MYLSRNLPVDRGGRKRGIARSQASLDSPVKERRFLGLLTLGSRVETTVREESTSRADTEGIEEDLE